MAVKQTMNLLEMWESVENNHDWIAEMSYRYAANLKMQRTMDEYAVPLDRFVAAVVYY